MIIEKHKANSEREICLCGLPIVQYGTKNSNGIKETYLSFFPLSFEHKALDMILKFIPEHKNHDHIWIIRTVGLGEAQLLNYMMSELRKKWKFKNPCFISHRTIYKQMFELYSDIPFYPMNLKHDDYAFYLKKRNVKYKGKYFHVHHCTIDESRKWLEGKQKGTCGHAIESYKFFSDVKQFDDVSPKFSTQTIHSALEKVNNLNLEKFVFIVPEANGAKKIDDTNWKFFINKLKEKGYDIFINTSSGNSALGKSALLNIAEASYIASLAKGIVAVRCGFAEILASIRERYTLYTLYTLYTPFRQLSSRIFIDTYTFKNYPFYNPDNTFEFEINSSDTDDIFNKIFDNIIQKG